MPMAHGHGIGNDRLYIKCPIAALLFDGSSIGIFISSWYSLSLTFCLRIQYLTCTLMGSEVGADVNLIVGLLVGDDIDQSV